MLFMNAVCVSYVCRYSTCVCTTQTTLGCRGRDVWGGIRDELPAHTASTKEREGEGKGDAEVLLGWTRSEENNIPMIIISSTLGSGERMPDGTIGHFYIRHVFLHFFWIQLEPT